MMLLAAVVLCLSALNPAPPLTSDDKSRAVYETEIQAGIDAVWTAFTTSEGLTTWMAPLAEIELAVGGKMRSNYNAEGSIGDSTTIENTILAYDPKRMLALKATGFPAGFPFPEAARATWSIFYFEPLGSDRTKIQVVGLGYTDSENSKKLRSFFAGSNKYVLDKLNSVLQQAAADRNPE